MFASTNIPKYERQIHAVMAEPSAEDSEFQRLKFYDEEDELEIFAVELMYNLMKHFNDPNYILLPKLPRPSKHYSPTVLKSVLLGWHITQENLSRRFQKALPFMVKSRHHLFSYATCQAVQLFDHMLWFAQLIFLAAYCYELSSFLSKNGLGEYLYVSYTLFCTLWKDQYEADFAGIEGWDHIEYALGHYAILYDPLEAIFLPGYRFDFDDLQAVQMEYEIVLKREKDSGDVPVEEEIENIFGSLEYRMRQRLLTVKDDQFENLQYVLNFSTLRFVEVSNVSTPRKLIQYLMHRAIKERKYTGYAALLEEHELPDFEPCLASSDYDSDDSVEALLKNKSRGRGQSSLQSLSIHDTPDNTRSEEVISSETKTAGRKKKKHKKSKAKTSQPKEGSEGSATDGRAVSEKITEEGPGDQAESLKQSESLKPTIETSVGDSATRESSESESPSKRRRSKKSKANESLDGKTQPNEGSATSSGAVSVKITEEGPDDQAESLKQSEQLKPSVETSVGDSAKRGSSESESPSKRRRSRKQKSDKT